MKKSPAARRRLLSFLVRTAVHCSANDQQRLRRTLAVLRRQPAWRRPALEAILEVHLFAGFPATIEGLFVLRGILGTGRAVGSRRTGAAEVRRRGERLCRIVYGSRYDRLVRAMEGLHPDFSSWILDYGYGTVLTRPGLTPAQREIVAVAVLTAGGWERQLESHLQGALNAGADPGDVRRAVREAGALAGPREGPSGPPRRVFRIPRKA